MRLNCPSNWTTTPGSIVSVAPDRELTFLVERDGERVTLTAVPQRQEIEDRFGNVHRVGLLGIQRSTDPGEVVQERSGPLEALWLGTQETWFVIDRTGSYIWGLVTGREAADQLGGPIRIAQISGQVAEAGFVALINLTAILSISIGILNLLPIPVLDGGHLLFYAIEAVRGRPLSERALDIGFRVGLALVLMLMVFVIWNAIQQVTGL
jgi:regulator of sigma E protease